MNSSSGDLINLALLRAFSSKSKKPDNDLLDEHLVVQTHHILPIVVEFKSAAQTSNAKSSEEVRNKYNYLQPSKLKKKKKKSKQLPASCNGSIVQMKNTELSGQNLSLPAPKTVLFSPDAVQLGWKNTYPVGSGFVNSGTTCYINSTLQALFHVPSFVNWLLDDKKHHAMCEKINGALHTECLVCAMSKTLHQSHRLTGSSLKPRLITEKVKTICKHLSPFRQEDAHEFLRYLMEAMEKSYIATLGIQAKKLDSYSKETTPLNQIFGGYIRTEVTCLECSQVSTTFQHFQDLILDIRQASTSTVYDALENYFSKERLDGDESYHCEHCKKKVSAYKKFSIEKAPNGLCIQLKRFNINSFYGGSKISKLISIPQNIDLSKFKHKKGSPTGAPLKYRLVSMVFHHGPSANSGHYTALGCTSSGSYYYFNDEQVYPTHLGQYTNNPNAYIMFYELEKPCEPSETASSSSIETSSSSSTITSLTNGYVNGTVQRSNGFFTKRDTSFSTSSIHSKQPSLEPIKCEKYSPMKSTATVTNVSKFSSTSLVPYMSSDSDSSDSEGQNGASKRMDKNNNSQKDDNVVENGERKTVSPLAKRNSTLTSLLNSSTKNAENGVDRDVHETNINGLTNGMSKTNGLLNGTNKTGSNGWIITDNSDNSEKSQIHGSINSDWIVTEGSKKCLSPFKDHKQDGQENNRKYHNGNEETKHGNVQNDTQNGSIISPYSSYNGYGGKVHTWNGELSYINQETDKERKESSKRNYNQSYDDDMDRGKVKKPKYHNRNENGSNQGPRKNPFQQYYNNNFNRAKRPSWASNGHHYGNNRRYQHNGYYRNNYYRAPSHVHNWKR